jgi:hypothetical protein
MTPSAMTAAGRSAAPRPAPAPPAPGRRHPGRGPQTPRPRRVSGPARGRAQPAAPAVAGRRPSIAARGLLVIRGLPEHTLLDRIVRGRAWIPLLGVLLVGIVAMQVEILKLGAGMGRWIGRSSTLQTRNEALQASVAALMDDQRIERLAAKIGMVMPDPTALSFLSAQPATDAARAAANIQTPDPSNFTAQLPILTDSSSSTSTSTSTGTSTGSSIDTGSSASATSTSQSSGSSGG